MRYFKSLLVVILVSVFAIQSNANILSSNTLMEEVVPPNIIGTIVEGRTAIISNYVNGITNVTLRRHQETVYEGSIENYETLKLSDLSPGEYTIDAQSAIGETSLTIVIE